MNGNHSSRSGRNCPFEELWIDIRSGRIDINKNRGGVTVRDGFGSRDESVGGSNDFVIRMHAEAKQSEVKCGSS